MSHLPLALRITMPDGSQWDIPADVIARNRAAFYADEYGGDVERSLADDTAPLFLADKSEIHDWAANQMDWEDVAEHAVLAIPPAPLTDRDKARAWSNGPKTVVPMREPGATE